MLHIICRLLMSYCCKAYWSWCFQNWNSSSHLAYFCFCLMHKHACPNASIKWQRSHRDWTDGDIDAQRICGVASTQILFHRETRYEDVQNLKEAVIVSFLNLVFRPSYFFLYTMNIFHFLFFCLLIVSQLFSVFDCSRWERRSEF